MPREDYVHLCIVLDASGSMEAIESDIKGTFKTFMDEQFREEGKTVIDVFQFSDEVARIVDRANAAEFKNDLMDSYRCSGCTALHDAVCTAIDTIGKEFSALPEEERPGKVLFVIITDGHENNSRQFTLKDVKERIDRQTNEYNWEFIYLAANQDEFEAESISGSMGVRFSSVAPGMADFASQSRKCMSDTLRRIRGERTPKK